MTALTISRQSTLTTQPMASLLQRFIRFAEVSEKSKETYLKAIRQFFAYLSSEGVENPTREDVIAYRDKLKEAHKPTTVQNYITALKVFFRWTAQEGFYNDIADHVKGAKLNRDHKKDYLTVSQLKAVLSSMKEETAREKRDKAIILLMLNGGLRDIEISRANIEDMGVIGNKTVLYLQGKGKEERTDFCIIDPITERHIRSYLMTRGDSSGDSPLFASTSNRNNNGRMTTRSISGIAKNSLVSCGFDSSRLTAHSIRHTAITLALMEGKSLQEVQQFARHSNISTTLIYAHNLDRINNSCGESVMKCIGE